MSQQIRLNKYLAERLGVSRREADELISAGKITVDGTVATLGARINVAWTGDRHGRDPVELAAANSTVVGSERTENLFSVPKRRPTDDAKCRGDAAGRKCLAGPVQNPIVRCNGKIVPYQAEFQYLALHKPVGYVCSRRAQGTAPTLYELLPPKYRKLKTVGRLDKDSSGLILLTNDGDFAFQQTHPKFRKTKVYEVELDKPLEPLHQQMISDFGVMLPDGTSRFMIARLEAGPPLSRESAGYDRGIRRASPVTTGASDAGPRKTAAQPRYQVVLTEGRNRQIRRTFAALGYEVTRLHRTEFGAYQLGDLRPGQYQEISLG